MSRILNAASVAAVGLTVAATLLLAEPGFASDLGADANAPVILLPGTEPAMKAETADLSTDAPVAPLADSPPDSIEPETAAPEPRSEEHTSELQSLMRTSTAVFCMNK